MATKWNANNLWSIDYFVLLTTLSYYIVCGHFPSLHLYFRRQPAIRRNFPMTRRQSRQKYHFLLEPLNRSINEAHIYLFFKASIQLWIALLWAPWTIEHYDYVRDALFNRINFKLQRKSLQHEKIFLKSTMHYTSRILHLLNCNCNQIFCTSCSFPLVIHLFSFSLSFLLCVYHGC